MKNIGKIVIMVTAAALLSVSCSEDDGPEVKTEGFKAADFMGTWLFNVDPDVKVSFADPDNEHQPALYMKFGNVFRFNEDGTWQEIEAGGFNIKQFKDGELSKDEVRQFEKTGRYGCPALTDHATHEGDILAHGTWTYDTETDSVTIDIDESDYVYCVLGRPGGRNHMKPIKKSIKGRYGFPEGNMIVVFDELYYAPGESADYWCQGYEATDGWRKLDKASDHYHYNGFQVELNLDKNVRRGVPG